MTTTQHIGHLNKEGMAACNGGRREEAFAHLLLADRLARQMHAPEQEARVRNNLGLVHQLSGNTQEALVCFRLAERNALKSSGKGSMLHKIIARNLTRLERAVEVRAA